MRAPIAKIVSVTLALAFSFAARAYDPAIGVFPNPVSVYATTEFLVDEFTGGPNPAYTYSWDYGDGGTDTGGVTTHIFTAARDFPVTLTVTDGVGNLVAT